MAEHLTEQQAIELGLLDPPQADAHIVGWLMARASALAEEIAAERPRDLVADLERSLGLAPASSRN